MHGVLERQLPVAEPILTAEFQRRLAKLKGMLSKEPALNPEKHLVDPIAYFGSEANVRQALAGRDAGWSAGTK